eukprot:6183809-Pleurochrysis_carterae.AAC.1
MQTTLRMATPASTAAAFGAAQLSKDGSEGVGCAPTWATSGSRRRRRHLRWRLSLARLWPTGRVDGLPNQGRVQSSSTGTASCGRDTHQTWCVMSQ